MKTIVRARETETGIRLKTRIDGKINYENIIFNNYFYMTFKDYQDYEFLIKENLKLIQKIEVVNDEYVKIILLNNFDRWKLKSKLELSGITLYEADLKAHERFLINEHPHMNSHNMKPLFYDIETKDTSNFVKDFQGNIIATEPILCIAYEDLDGNKYFIKNENKNDPVEGEIQLLKFHNLLIDSYDIILGWNSKGFDDTYIKQRSEFHRLNIMNWEFINQIDYMELVKKYTSYEPFEKYSLNHVSQEVLGENKLDELEAGNGNIYNAWLKSFEGDDTLQRYNERDVSLMIQIEKKLNFLDLVYETCDYTKCFSQETLYNSIPWDLMLLQDFKKLEMIATTKPNEEEKNVRQELKVFAAYTFCNHPGVYNNIEVFDFKSFYPTTGTQCNICFTTKIEKEYAEKNNIPYCTIPEDTHYYKDGTKVKEIHFEEKYFRLDKRGIIADRFDELIGLRDFYKKNKWQYKETNPDEFKRFETKEQMFKILANSGYGVLAQKSFRFFDEYVANAITTWCRALIKKCEIYAKDSGFKVIQGDTDSIMIYNEKKYITIKELEEEFKIFFDDYAKKYNVKSKVFQHKDGICKDHLIVLEHEKTFPRFLAVAGKNYAALKQERDTEGNPIGEPKISITGLECKKKNTNPLAKKLQFELIEGVLRETINIQDFISKLKEVKEQVMNNTLDTKYLVMKQTLQKPFSEYGKPIIDKSTGLPKLNKAGEIIHAPIPAVVKLAMRLTEEGKNITTGDLIEYIVESDKPINPMTVKEYEDGKDYAREYYWEKIITPVLKIILVTHPEVVLENYKLWRVKEFKNEKQVETYIEKLKKKLGDD